jgi:HPt (histidine-containing phosphotransfer) domain-containing protein
VTGIFLHSDPAHGRGTPLARLSLMVSQPGAIDPRDLLAICRTGSTVNTALLHEILGYFVRQNRDRMTIALQALEAADRPQLAEVAHAVKGSAAMLGAGHLADLANRIQLEAASASPASLVAAVTAMRHEFEAVLQTLHAQYPDAF